MEIVFVCHGNICRSPLAEFVFRDMADKRGLSDLVKVSSAATSREEIGNPVHRGTKNILTRLGLSAEGKRAVQLKKQDYAKYDYLIGMETRNITNMLRIIEQDGEHKVFRLLDFTEEPGDIDDPWYTGDFERTFREVVKGCEGLLDFILERHEILHEKLSPV